MTLISRTFRLLNLLRAQQGLIEAQQRMIDHQTREFQRMRLEYIQQMLGITSSWRIHMETPEIDLRCEVEGLAQELANQAATLEEHVL